MPLFEIFLKYSELKTTHNTFWDCRMHFFQKPFLKQLYMWAEFVVGSLSCSERFFSRYSSFPLSSRTNIFKFPIWRQEW